VFNRFWWSYRSLGKNIRLGDQLFLVKFLFQCEQQIVRTIITQNLTVFTAMQKSVFLVEVVILWGKLLLYCLDLIFRFIICLYSEQFTHCITEINESRHAAVVLWFGIHYFGNIKISKLAFAALEVNITLIIFEKAERTKFSSSHCNLLVAELENRIGFHLRNLCIQFQHRFMNLLSKICTLYGNTHRIIISAVKLVALYNRTKYHLRIFSEIAVYPESVLRFAKMHPVRKFFRQCGTLL